MNGTINISGTTSDNNLINKVYLYISTLSNWALLPTDYAVSWTEPTGKYNWNLPSYDTTALSDMTPYYVFVKTFDSAGNGSDLSLAESSLSFNVDQESDRPVIYLSNMVEGGSANGLAQDASVIGRIEDDDLVDASSLEIRVDVYNDSLFPGVILNGDGDTLDANESEDWVPILPGATGADDVKILSWTHSLVNLPQGTHSIQIRVHDSISDALPLMRGRIPTTPSWISLSL